MKPAEHDLPFLLHGKDLHDLSSVAGRSMQALETLRSGFCPHDCGLIRTKAGTGRSFFLSSIEGRHDESDDRLVHLTTFPNRRDLLHAIDGNEGSVAHAAKQAMPLRDCAVDILPARYALFAAFVPSVLYRIERTLLVTELQHNILPAVPFTNRLLFLEAVSVPSARETSDYNRLEFLGDATLKFYATVYVMAKHLTWPEGYLTLEKSRIVSNNALTKTAMQLGLDAYINTKPFTGLRWRPPYVDEMLSKESGMREMSSKVLADVVEAPIGAAFVDGRLQKAYDCICALLPGEDWSPLPECITIINAESVTGRHVELGSLEKVIGHKFRSPELLAEAVTHASFLKTVRNSSYERLELLRDAVLDLVVVPKLFQHPRELRHFDLHRVRCALVNGDYLAYCCMQNYIEEDVFDVVSSREQFDVHQSKRCIHLHDFMRCGSKAMKAKSDCLEQSSSHLQAIQRSLTHDTQYPWPELVAFKPPKFFSDIVESTLGALFLDTAGDLSVCEAFLERLGIFDEMRRILDEHV